MSGGFGVPRMDWSPLERLGDRFAAGYDDGRRRMVVEGLGVAPGDPQFLPKLGQGLLGMGDVNGALAVSRLMENSQDRSYQRQQDAMNWDWRRQEVARQDARDQRDFTARREDAVAARGLRADSNRWTEFYRAGQAARDDQRLELQKRAAEQSAKEAEAKASAVKALPAELGARVALGQSFLDQAPALRKQVEAGGVTGPWDAMVARSGRGDAGEVLRQWRSGKEAIIRNLTGAGMNQSEAESSVAQYEPSVRDDAATALRKFDMMTDQLRRIEAEAYRGRGVPEARRGKNPYFEGPAATPPATSGAPTAPVSPGAEAAAAPSANRVDSFDAIPEGRRYRGPDGKVYRKVNGQAVPE